LGQSQKVNNEKNIPKLRVVTAAKTYMGAKKPETIAGSWNKKLLPLKEFFFSSSINFQRKALI